MSRSTRHDLERGTLRLELELKHPPVKVWRALTQPELLSEWLLPVVGLKLERGATFRLEAPAQPGWDGVVSCRVLELDEPHRLSYGWDLPSLQTVVTFTLTPTAAGTRLCIEQSGFKADQKQELGGARYGWEMMTAQLGALLEREP